MYVIYMLLAGFLSVNSQGVVGGNDDNDHQCQPCLRGACRTTNGIYMRPDLPPGYSLVAQIPKGACGVHVQQLKHTRNILALKISGNSSYLLNGDWNFGPSRSQEAAGTKITYVKQDHNSLESIQALGPLTVPLDVMIVSFQANPGIKYRYSYPPEDEPVVIAPPLLKKPSPSEGASLDTRRLDSNSVTIAPNNQRDDPKTMVHPGSKKAGRRRRNFHWKITGTTPCSKSCGGGIQTYTKICVRVVNANHHIPTHERRCAHLDPPAFTPVPCNVEPCVTAFWDGAWGQCSVSCGEGLQQYLPLCKKEVGGKLIVVSDAQCSHENKPIPQTRVCQERDCSHFKGLSNNEVEQPKKEWTVGGWSHCTVTCGNGHRTRYVSCPSGQCDAANRPPHVEYCHPGPCLDSAPSQSSRTTVSASQSWLLTEWSQCSAHCGLGNQTRFALCEEEHCNPDSRPELSRACSSEKHCDGQWFAGPWGECSDSCTGPAKQKREVLCIAKIRGVSHVTNDKVCPIATKPYEEQSCYGVCPPQWFTGDWGKCEGNCPSGIQRREVRCLDLDKRPSNACPEDKVPPGKRACACEPSHRENRDSFTLHLPHDDPEVRSCVDRIPNCRVAVQARLCSYLFYTRECCESCRKGRQDMAE